MRTFIPFLGLTLLCLVGPVHAADSEITVVGALDFAYKNLTLETPNGGANSSFDTTLVTLNPGVAVAYKRFYANFNFDKSIDSGATTQVENMQPSMLTMSRSDVVLTLGYRVFDYLSVFTGWLNGEIGAYLVGNRQTQTMPTVEVAFYTQDISYKEQGPFAGLALSHNFGEKGSVSFSIAYASLSGTLSQTRYIGGPTPSVSTEPASPDVKGLSYGLIWTGPLNGSMNYRLGVKSTRYEGSGQVTSGGGGTEPFNLNEYYTSVFLGFTNVF